MEKRVDVKIKRLKSSLREKYKSILMKFPFYKHSKHESSRNNIESEKKGIVKMDTKRELHYKYNFFYLTSILLIVIITLITVKLGRNEDLVKYFSFGLTLTSLFLALIAIVYAIISNTTFSQHLGTLRDVTQTVVNASESMSKMNSTLDSKIAEIPSLIHNVESKLDETQKDIKESLAQRSQVEEVPSVTKSVENESNKATFISSFLELSSFYGLLALYTAQIAYRTKKPFDILKVWTNETIDSNYGFAYIVASSSAGILSHTSKDSMINVTFFDERVPNLRDNLENWLKEKEKIILIYIILSTILRIGLHRSKNTLKISFNSSYSINPVNLV